MITQLDPRIIEVLKGNDRNKRVYITSRSLVYHAIYYHPEYFDYAIASFHFDLYDDFECLTRGELKEAAWVIFREGAKTSIAEIGIEWLVVNRLKRYINVDSFDKSNSEGILYNVALALQTNQRLISDYGQIYFTEGPKEKSQVKRLNNFVTENGVRVEAYSTQQSTRGRKFNHIRPDFFLFDDIETNNTKDSYAKTAQVKKHVAEAQAGLGVNGCALYLGNFIVEDGSIAWLKENLEPRDDAVFRDIPVMSKTGVLVWPDKYVMTKNEAREKNQMIDNPLRQKVAIEAKKEQLKGYFEPEMMNNPSKSGDYLFNREVIEAKKKLTIPPIREIAGMKIWAEYDRTHRYGSGSDTSEGNGLDAGTHAIIDFTRLPNLLVSTFKSNAIPPDQLAHEIAREGAIYAYPYEATELNNTGWATVAMLRNPLPDGGQLYPIERLYQRRQLNHLSKQLQDEVGWRTGHENKSDIIFSLIAAVQDGALEILDENVLNEMKYYARRDLLAMKHEEGMTRHFDLLMAVALAWHMRNYAPLPKAELLAKVPAQPAYEPSSLYESAGQPQKRRAAGEPIIFEPEKKKPEGNDWPSMLDELTENGGSSFGDYPGGNTPGRGIY